MRKKLAFSGFIMATCVYSLETIGYVIYAIIIGTILAGAEGNLDEFTRKTIIILISVLAAMLIMVVGLLILNAGSISSTKDAQTLAMRKGSTITAVVFNFIIVLLDIIGLILGTSSTLSIALNVIMMLVLVVANILIIIDIAGNNKEVGAQIKMASPQTQNNEDKINSLEEEINKLILLKAKNLITEEEFNQLKKREIEKRL